MKKENVTVSVGISVFNEENNITALLRSILSQKGPFRLIEIIVVSDGSTDNTVPLAKTVFDNRIKFVSYKKREGKVQRFNEIVKFASGDILVMLDADVILNEKNFISKLINPFFRNDKVGIVGAKTVSARPRTFFEKVIADSHECKQKMYEKLNNGNTIYLCHGRARGFRRELYTQMQWINNCPEDAQSYLFCIQKGFLFQSTPDAQVTFRSPTTFADHAKQHDRFLSGQKKLQQNFPASFVNTEYFIPKPLIFEFLIQFFLKNPITMISYLLITLYLNYLHSEKSSYTSLWSVSYSTKKISL